ncbi:DNA methyltransferase [Croceicoccus sp. BE223]|uniref:class I SAM-dependent DNA methyltransferase n=1 Tax=Croceicoccus sp. BE223 TaxID=2817716 RepID=UPI002858ABB4|nr:DNA methyltransferase [Croceicoccus sp. BE223]MDR7102307.1 type II restriction/modification system DNA methylase subunit YeeA [Croceicoccus sp. BE223]
MLDPACGSGNFLYLSLLALKDLEHRANLEAEALGCSREFPAVGPECVLGIELNPYAAELARVSVWIGEIQWMRRNGFEASRNPILRSLGNIECRDAVLDVETGRRAAWPEANVVVGNPPFLGGSKKRSELGLEYTETLKAAWPHVPGGVDLVCYWFAGAWDRMVACKLERAGLVSTNSIRGGANREVIKPIVAHGRIFEAWGDEAWTVDGAAVRVSLICFERERGDETPSLNGLPVDKINSDLTDFPFDLTSALRLSENKSTCFEGGQKHGPFEVDDDTARAWLQAPRNPNGRPNSDVLRRFVNATDIVRRMSDAWVVDFGAVMSEHEAAFFEQPFEHIHEHVKPVRMKSSLAAHRDYWWRHHRTRPELRKALGGKSRYLVTPVVAKHRVFTWLTMNYWPTNLVDAIARDDDTTFGILHSRFHELWALGMGTSLEDRPRYTPSTTFETFPFPEGLTPATPAADYAEDPRAQAISTAAARLNELRENWLNPPDLIERVPEVVPGYPDRILPKDEAAAQVLKKRTLTNLYNQRPAWLDHAHRALDEAVADAYGWGDDFRAGTLTDDEILARLFHLNQERAARQ